MARVFELYATGEYWLKAITERAHQLGLRHPRADRRMTKSEIHRMLQRLVYTGDFIWKGTRYAGSHEPLITRARFEDVHAVPRQASIMLPKAATCVQRTPDVRPLRVLLDGGDEEGQVRLLPL